MTSTSLWQVFDHGSYAFSEPEYFIYSCTYVESSKKNCLVFANPEEFTFLVEIMHPQYYKSYKRSPDFRIQGAIRNKNLCFRLKI
jgi:hypothetical protein